jgi:hypothetical protein
MIGGLGHSVHDSAGIKEVVVFQSTDDEPPPRRGPAARRGGDPDQALYGEFGSGRRLCVVYD